MITPARFTYFQAVKRWIPNKIDSSCVRFYSIGSINRTHSKTDVRFCSITEPNRTIGVHHSIEIDWILFD